ncbi:polycystic kidney disease protein 1-like [Desmophyllum pertusum]|uniref:Polycystic kidney disease protein 1-like n=1 Tax=Desmophyllum pertusum TaxID=174260 RepID=A0A9X0D9M8_9CNID|nr:polycystic kidney disease protein 1-like [Desmophyllum pertusum]
MLGKFSYVSLERTNRVLGPLMFFFYSIGVVFILVNMFLSIIIENFRRVKGNNDLQSNEHEIVDFMAGQFMNWLGLRSRSMFKNRVFAEGHFEQPVYKKRKRADEAAQLKERVDRLVTLIQKVHFDDKDQEEDFLRNDGEVTYLVPDIKLESYA